MNSLSKEANEWLNCMLMDLPLLAMVNHEPPSCGGGKEKTKTCYLKKSHVFLSNFSLAALIILKIDHTYKYKVVIAEIAHCSEHL